MNFPELLPPNVGKNINKFKKGYRIVCAPYIECGNCNHRESGLGELYKYKSFTEGASSEYTKISNKIVEKKKLLS